MQVCPNCGEENPAKFRLCGYCGTALASAAPPQELRKTVTIVFSDLKGSTALAESIDPEALHEIKNQYFGAMAAVLEHHGGKIEKYIGDAIMAVFGLPKAREDDALRAVRAALGMQQELHRINVGLERSYGITLAARMGVNTGEVVATTDPNADQRLADGDTVNVAARLEQAAPPMEVLIGDITHQLVRDHVVVEPVEPLTLKGKSEPVPAYRLVAIGSPTVARATSRAPLVGREAETAIIDSAFREAVRDEAARLVTVVGDAGVGKSRLLAEFKASVPHEARVLRGRCLPYGDGITFWPLVEVARDAAGIAEDDTPDVALAKIGALVEPSAGDRETIVERLASAIGLSDATFPVSELFWGARKFLEALAVDRPLVVIIDDIHSAEATFLELLDHLIDTAGAPILLLCSARHELLDDHPDWGQRQGARRIVLQPLSEANTELIIDRLLGQAGLDPEARRRVANAAEGNPLFIEQMVSMLVDRRMVRLDGDVWVPVGDLSNLTIPPTITALLTARLDHLSGDERAVIEPASVVGLVFSEPAVEELVPDQLRADVLVKLGDLDRRQFVHPAGGGDDEAYRFHHILIRDAAYNSILKRARAQLHERFVAWAERVNRERGREIEFEAILGYHLEQAFRYRGELGPLDDEGRALGRRAADKLSSAGRRALVRGDMPAASNLLLRAGALLERDDRMRIELLPDAAEALQQQGKFDTATEVLSDATEAARRIGDDRLEARAVLQRLMGQVDTSDPSLGFGQAVEEIERIIALFEPAGDDAGLARGWRLLMHVKAGAGKFGEATEAAQRQVECARRAGDERLMWSGAANHALMALLGPSAVSEVLPVCEQLLDQVRGHRRAESLISGALSVLYAMQGSFDRARELYASSKRMLDELGPSVTASATSTESSRVELLAGDPVAAERELRRDFDALGTLGEKYLRSTIAGLLAEAVYQQGRFAEATQLTQVVRELASEDDSASQMHWRTVEAKLAARRGDAETALTLAGEALALAQEVDSPALAAGVQVDTGEVHILNGHPESAGPPWREALELFERKGDVVSAARLRARLDGLAAAAAIAASNSR